jgi:uncharacterized membrane protein
MGWKKVIGGILAIIVLILTYWAASLFLNTFNEIVKFVPPKMPPDPFWCVWLPIWLGISVALVAILAIIALCIIAEIFSRR